MKTYKVKHYLTVTALTISLSVLAALALAPEAHADSQERKWRIDIHGKSHHFDRCYRFCTKNYNETNLGLGLAYKVNEHIDLMGGFYQNSFNNRSTYAALNFGQTIGYFTPGIMLGGITGYTFDGRDQRDIGLAVLPNVSLDVDRFQLNMGFIPKNFGGKSAVLTFRAGIRF